MMRAAIITAVALVPSWAMARECVFEASCIETEACTSLALNAEIDIPNGTLITDYGTALNEGYMGRAGSETMLFRDDDRTFLLTVASNEARLTVHHDEGPRSETYLGMCEAR